MYYVDFIVAYNFWHKKIHFCLGFLGEQVEDAIRKSDYFESLNITFSYDGEILLGTGGTIRKIINQLPDYFFVTYGDSYLDIDFYNVQQIFELKNTKFNSLMTVYENKDLFDTSNVVFENNSIELYSKSKKDIKMSHIDYGVGILSNKCMDFYDKNIIFDLSELYENLSLKNNDW